ncbi:MAG TPA: hypothetical protein VFW11_24205 [Cyclobacteriaceae bacterium]|nr:hypothetical protein [Cyclobacteriaceae bacterium]
MTPSLPSSTEFLLPPGLGDLHQKTLTWESNIELWKRELTFFQKLIAEYGTQLQLRDHIKEREHFKMLLNYYKNQLMNTYSGKMIRHEEKLKSLMSDGMRQEESKYRDEHHELERQINTFEKELQCFKHELYLLIEKVLLRNKLKKS